MVEVVGAVDGVIRADGDAVGAVETAFAPGGKKTSVAVKDNDRMFAAIENVNAIAGIRSDAGHFAEAPAGGQLFPALQGLVVILPLADDGVHGFSPVVS